MDEFTDAEKTMLDLERGWWKYPGAKESAIHEQLGMTATVYYRSLHHLIARPEAMAYDPLLVKRLHRQATARRRQRSARRLGFQVDAQMD
ncbi:DUF3263 domain-containing protein [Pimelobacter simplex]|uniref:DUF3263 domain-containing protein n=1 Tax=Nocardioides simplex TaxID=2045 RepID=UPI00214FF73B|nr:DUF3263 domain-containing protein [Pimelobacter simplex]UUW88487.1 DUF3263 domain-containing protein [Pimelobacter simplex]UUW97991.1 DUF3263 domain-containing protein [Pimelobacter simplex]